MAENPETLVVDESSLLRALLSPHSPLGADEITADLHTRKALDLILVDAEEGSDLLAALQASRVRGAIHHEN